MTEEEHRLAESSLGLAVSAVRAALQVNSIPDRQRRRLDLTRKLLNSVRNDLDELAESD